MNDELAAAERRIFEHPAYREHRRVDAFARSLVAVFLANQRELLALVNRAATDEMLAIELIQNVRPPTVREQFHAETIQRLHNYVAATMTLVDHSRRIMDGRTGPVAEEFEIRKADLLKNPEVHFIKDLRAFMLHRSLPFLAHTLSFSNVNTPQASMSSEVELSTAELRTFKKWTAKSRVYLKEHPEAIQVRPLVTKHGHLIFSLNLWLYRALGDANAAGLEEVNRLVIERNAVLAGVSFEEAKAATDRWSHMRGYPQIPDEPPSDPAE